MTEEMYQRGLKKLESMSTEELYAGLVDAGFHPDSLTVRQFPEPEEKPYASKLRELQQNQYAWEPSFAG